MKNRITKLLLVVAFFFVMNACAQSSLWSMSEFGGANNMGAVFKVNIDGTDYTRVHDGSTNPDDGQYFLGSLMQATNGKLYGMTAYNDIIFNIDVTTNVYTKLINFDGGAYGKLIQASNGKLYGMSFRGGIYGFGTIFSFDPNTNIYDKLFDFNDTTGADPLGNLIEASDGKLYGMTQNGGIYRSSYYGLGVMFSFDIASNTYHKILDFDNGSNGGNPSISLIQSSDGKLYGMTQNGGINGMGVLFNYDIASNIYSKLIDFNFTDYGSNPIGSLIQASDGKLYGMAYNGGINGDGTLFSFNIISNTITKLLDFSNVANGRSPFGSLIQSSNGKLYGMTYNGGIYGTYNDYGVIFAFDIGNNTITKLRDLNPPDGTFPYLTSFIEVGNGDTIRTCGVLLNLCKGTNIKVPFVSGILGSGNVFTAQLSSSTGSFTSPVNIGTLTSVSSGTIPCIIPSNTPNGTGYRIRVVSSNPSIIGYDNGSNITISTLSTPTIIPSGATSFCQGGSVGLSVNTTYSSYLWSNGATTQSINVNTSGTYMVTVSNNGYCTSSAQKTVTVYVLPVPNIQANGSTTLCPGGSVTLSVCPYTSYNWSNGATTQSITVNSGNNYSITATNSNGCTGSGTRTVISNDCDAPSSLSTTNITATCAYLIWVPPYCFYGYSIRRSIHDANNWNTYTITPNSHYTFSALVHNTSYDWQIRTNCNSAQTIVSDWSPIQTFTTAARLEDEETDNGFSSFVLYPNPTKDYINIAFPSNNEEVYSLRLLDVTGRLIINQNNKSEIGDNNFQLNLGGISKGIYLIRIQKGDAIMQKRLVVE